MPRCLSFSVMVSDSLRVFPVVAGTRLPVIQLKMATDVATRLKDLGEEEAEEHWKELLAEFKQYTAGEDCILWAEALALFIQKTLSYVSDIDAESIISSLSPIASDACDATLKSLKKWTTEEDVLDSLHVSSRCICFIIYFHKEG